jgi:hypothetical protein
MAERKKTSDRLQGDWFGRFGQGGLPGLVTFLLKPVVKIGPPCEDLGKGHQTGRTASAKALGWEQGTEGRCVRLEVKFGGDCCEPGGRAI